MSQGIIAVSRRFKIQAGLWLVMAVGTLVLWLILWFMSGTPKVAEKIQKTKSIAQEPTLPTYIKNFNQLTKEVPPADFSMVVRDLRSFPNEFKDKRYFEKGANRWTVQVMDVSSNTIITDYLNNRSDRDKFAYFRYHNTNNELRYILTYGMMGDSKETLEAIKNVSFGLPPSMKAMPEQMERYLKMIDNYERSEVLDSAPDAPRAIKLTPAKSEVAATPAKPSSQSSNTPRSSSSSASRQNTSSENTQSTSQRVIAKPSAPAPDPIVHHDLAMPEQPPRLVAPVQTPPSPAPVDEVRYEATPEKSITPNTNTSRIPGSE